MSILQVFSKRRQTNNVVNFVNIINSIEELEQEFEAQAYQAFAQEVASTHLTITQTKDILIAVEVNNWTYYSKDITVAAGHNL